MFCNLNGEIVERNNSQYSSADDSFRLRYGLYETFLFRDGKIEFENLHWKRLWSGLEILDFQFSTTNLSSFFKQQINELVKKSGFEKLARVRLQIFTDSIDDPFVSQYLIECFPLEESICTWLSEGIEIEILDGFRKKRAAHNNCKISHNTHYSLAQKMMKENNFDDMLLQNEEGNVIESAIANLFWVNDNRIFTTPLSDGCVAGTMRAVVLEKLKENQISFEEKSIQIADLFEADEIFVTNSIRKIRWVREWYEKRFGNEITKSIYKLI